MVKVKQSAFCVGLGNGWTGNPKALLIMPEEAGKAYQALKAVGLEPRGFGFWDINDEGTIPYGQTEPLYLAQGLNDFLKVRSDVFLE